MKQSQKPQQASSQANSRPAQADDKAFFNLHTSGIGYLSRVRLVEGGKRKGSTRRGDSFLCCAINALHGSVDDPNYSYFDLKVAGGEATEVIQKLQKDVDAKRKVLVAFRVGDIYAHAYERDVRDDNGRATGEKEIAACIKGRLLLITQAKVDGVVVYQREDESAAGSPPADDAPAESMDDAGDGGEDELSQDDEAPRSFKAQPARHDRASARGTGRTLPAAAH